MTALSQKPQFTYPSGIMSDWDLCDHNAVESPSALMKE